MRQHRRPYLPFDSVLVLAEERLELERLIEFLKEEFNRPSRFVESRDHGRAPLEVVRAESLLAHLPLDLDKGLDATQRLGIVRTCRRARQPYRLVGDDTCRQIISGHALHDSVSGRLLFPDDEAKSSSSRLESCSLAFPTTANFGSMFATLATMCSFTAALRCRCFAHLMHQ